MSDPLIRVEHLYKVFGNAPGSVMPMVRDGRSKNDILAQTGHTVALRDISLEIDRGQLGLVSQVRLFEIRSRHLFGIKSVGIGLGRHKRRVWIIDVDVQ